MNDRLNEIKVNWENADWGIDKDDVDWLIQQTEKVEKLQGKLDVVIDELRYALNQNKSEEVRNFYVENAIRFIEEIKENFTNSN